MSINEKLFENEECTWPEAISAALRERKNLFDNLLASDSESDNEEGEDSEETLETDEHNWYYKQSTACLDKKNHATMQTSKTEASFCENGWGT